MQSCLCHAFVFLIVGTSAVLRSSVTALILFMILMVVMRDPSTSDP
jgi:hypothetical protein